MQLQFLFFPIVILFPRLLFAKQDAHFGMK